MAWVTEGKEVENYIPRQAIQALYPNKIVDRAVQKFEAIDKYLDRISSGERKKFLRKKVVFAEKVRRHITKEGIESRLDLAEKLEELCEQIKRWNSM